MSYSTFAKLKFCAIPQLEMCAIPQFRKNQRVGDGVCFLEFNFWKNLVLECLPFGLFFIIDQWQLSSNLTGAHRIHLKLFNRIKILPSFTLSNFYFTNFGPLKPSMSELNIFQNIFSKFSIILEMFPEEQKYLNFFSYNA